MTHHRKATTLPQAPCRNLGGATRAPARATCRGFTLLELVIVIAILGVLATVSFQFFGQGIHAARIATSSQNLRQLASANMLYASDHGVYAPADDRRGLRRWHGSRRSTGQAFDISGGFLAPYLGENGEVGRCPLLAHVSKSSSTFEEGTGGYGYNSQYIGGMPGGAFDRATGLRISRTVLNIDHPSRTVMFATTAYARRDGIQEYPFAEPPYWDFGDGPSGRRPSPTVHFRANGKALIAWADGSVSAEPMSPRSPGTNPHGGDADEHNLGWFGPDEENGYWNPRRMNP